MCLLSDNSWATKKDVLLIVKEVGGGVILVEKTQIWQKITGYTNQFTQQNRSMGQMLKGIPILLPSYFPFLFLMDL